MSRDILIGPACDPDDMDLVRELFVEYQQWLGIDLCFQGFEKELATLPGRYAVPRGCILLAKDGADIAGGIALRPLENGICEMKRLFVREKWRGQGLGRRLTEDILSKAGELGYAAMRLDTEKRLKEAIALYRKLGFVEIDAYCDNPLEDVLYLEKKLT